MINTRLTKNVLGAVFLMNRRDANDPLISVLPKLLKDMNREETLELRYYVEHGTFSGIHADLR